MVVSGAADQFSHEQFSSAYPEGMQNHFWIKTRSLLIAKKLNQLTSRPSLILDIGCGPGFMVRHLSRLGFCCRGVELGRPEVIPEIRHLVDLGVGFQDLDSAILRSVDTVLLLDLLEHIVEPKQMLRSICELMPNVQDVFITLPARQELWSNYDDYYGHHLRYDLGSIQELLSEVPLVIKQSFYFFHGLYLPMLLVKLLGISRAVMNRPPRPLWLHHMLAKLFLLDALLLPGSWYGASLMVHLRRMHPATVTGARTGRGVNGSS